MIWLIAPLAALVAFALFIIIVGRRLPTEYVSTIAMELEAPADAVYDALQQPDKCPIAGKQCRNVTNVERDGEFLVWTEDMGQSAIRYKTVEARRPERIVREAADDVVPVTFEQTLELESAGETTRLSAKSITVIQDGTWHVPLFRFAMKVMDGANRANRDYLERVAKRVGVAPRFLP